MARKVIAEFDAIDGPFINKLRAIDASVTRFERGTLTAFGRVEKGVNGLLASAARLQNVSGIIAGGFGANISAQFIDQAVRIRRALKEAGDDSQAAFEKAFLASQRSLAGFEAFSQGVQRMAKATGGTFDESVRDMETLNKLLVLGGKTTQERMSTMIQFSQALQAGVLQGEELRSLRENAPIELIRAIAKEAGGTIEDLKKFGEAGVLTTDVMIRALQSLEKEADLRIKSVTLTISEAATVLGNAGIVAAEGFDKGLGLSRATVAGLTALADVLGQSAEVMELFGQAAKLAGALFITSFAGRKVNEAAQAQVAFSKGLRDTAAATRVAQVAAASEMATSRARVATLRAELIALQASGAAKTKLAAVTKRYEAAQFAASRATSAHTASVYASAVAQERLSITSRAFVAAGSAARAAWAFLGGIPGILLTLGTAYLLLANNAESATERFERLTSNTGEAGAAADALRDVQSRLNDAIKASGETASESSRKILAATQQEYDAKKKLLELETQRLAQTQFDRVKETVSLRDEQNQMRERQQGILDYFNTLPDQEKVLQADGLQESLNNLAAKIKENEEKIIALRAAHEDAARIITDNNAIIGKSFSDVSSTVGGVAIPDEAIAKYDELLAKKREEIALQQLITQYGAESAQVADFRAASERAAYEQAALAAGVTGDLLVSLMAAYDEASALSQLDLESNIAAGASRAAELARNFGIALAAAASIAAYEDTANRTGLTGPDGVISSLNGGGRFTPPVTGAGLPSIKIGKGGGGGGGGGGGSRVSDIDREALQFIESMLTAEEKRAQKLKEVTELRAQLVAKYGEEHEMVQRVDEAMKRMNETLEEGNSLQEEFWGLMSDQIAQSIEDWKGWGNFVRSVLASFVRTYGEDFFIALLTPGKQSGGGLGTLLGDALTGKSAASGRTASTLLSPSVSGVAAKISLSDATLPASVSAAGAPISIVNINDFRGVDNSSRDYIEGRLRQMERGLPDQVVSAVRTAQRKRRL